MTGKMATRGIGSLTALTKAAMSYPPNKLLLDYQTAADMLSISKQALRDLVYQGRGPITTKIARRTFFTPQDLEDFVSLYRDLG